MKQSNKEVKEKKYRNNYYQLLAEQWFDEHYTGQLSLWKLIQLWWFDIDIRKSVVSMYGRYLDNL